MNIFYVKNTKYSNFQPIGILRRPYLYVSLFLTPEVSENTSQYQPVLSAAVRSLHIKYVANLMT